jgi:hypothetical protein
MYKIRSKIVHAGQKLQNLENIWEKIPDIEISDPAQFVEISRDTAREILREYTLRFVKGQSPQMVRKELERDVIKALDRNGKAIGTD